MHLFYNASRIIKMVILVDLSAIFGISTVNFSPFQGPNRLDTLLPQSCNTPNSLELDVYTLKAHGLILTHFM